MRTSKVLDISSEDAIRISDRSSILSSNLHETFNYNSEIIYTFLNYSREKNKGKYLACPRELKVKINKFIMTRLIRAAYNYYAREEYCLI